MTLAYANLNVLHFSCNILLHFQTRNWYRWTKMVIKVFNLIPFFPDQYLQGEESVVWLLFTNNGVFGIVQLTVGICQSLLFLSNCDEGLSMLKHFMLSKKSYNPIVLRILGTWQSWTLAAFINTCFQIFKVSLHHHVL